jgi:type VI secretion system protein ImpA
MSAFDVEALLAPVSAESPCGENLEYDADYVAMELAGVGKPEQQFGDTVIPAEEPDWRELRSKALDLLPRSKDLRTAVCLTRAAARIDGLGGLADGLQLLAGYVEKYWDGVHPLLDPDDDNDPTVRVNSLASLCDSAATLKGIREATLVRSKALGKFSYRDVQVASGELPPPSGTEKIEQSAIDGAFADADPQELRETGRTLRRALKQAKAVENVFTERVGAGSGPQLDSLTELLAAMSKLVNQKLAARGLTLDEPSAAAAPADEPAAADGDDASSEQPASSASNGRKASASVALTGDISSREDVIRALDKICDYYKRYEPSSPVPLFLIRAKRLASKSFLEILRDLTPDAVNQALAIGGIGEGVDALANEV